MQISIIDYGAGNTGSVLNALDKLGYKATLTCSPEAILQADAVIFPGVGAAADTVDSIKRLGLEDVINKLVNEDKPLFAICVGLQVLFSRTEEGGSCECLNILPGEVKRLPSGLKVPHMGWNQVNQTYTHSLFNGIPDKTNFYFVHSYYVVPEEKDIITATTEYGISFCSMISKRNLVATQFHPEKSGKWGLKMYQNFIEQAAIGGFAV